MIISPPEKPGGTIQMKTFKYFQILFVTVLFFCTFSAVQAKTLSPEKYEYVQVSFLELNDTSSSISNNNFRIEIQKFSIQQRGRLLLDAKTGDGPNVYQNLFFGFENFKTLKTFVKDGKDFAAKNGRMLIVEPIAQGESINLLVFHNGVWNEVYLLPWEFFNPNEPGSGNYEEIQNILGRLGISSEVIQYRIYSRAGKFSKSWSRTKTATLSVDKVQL